MKLVHFVLICFVVASTLTVAQNSTVNFANPVNYPSGGQDPTQVVVADVNGDGKPDLIVANDCASGSSPCEGAEGLVAVLLGNGNGTFQTAVTYDSGGANATSLAVADVNGDGYPDLIVTNYCVSTTSCANGTVAVLLNKGNGTFQPAVTYNSGGIGASSVAVGSLRGNGTLDLIVANCAGLGNANGVIGVLLGNGNGTFQSAVPYNAGGLAPGPVAVADLRSDGMLDVIVATGSTYLGGVNTAEVGVLLGNGDGTLQSVVLYDTGGYDAAGLAVADVNGDGKPDILATNYCGPDHTCSNGGDGSVGVLLGNGDGTFQTAVTYDSGGGGAGAITVAEVNGDSVPDAVVIDGMGPCNIAPGAPVAAVLLGVGNGTFAPAINFCTGIAGNVPGSVAVADVNGASVPDLLVTNQYVGSTVGSLAVLLDTVVVLSPGILTFGNHAPGTTSYSLTATLTNTGSTTLNISSISIIGANASEFSQTNTCGTSVSAGQHCTISVVFRPTAYGNAGATLQVSYNLPGGPQTVGLFGTGSGPGVGLSPSSISFPSQMPGTTSSPQIVTLTNTGNATLTISSVAASSNFNVVNGCGNSVAAGTSCSIAVSFEPTQGGTIKGTLTVTDNAVGSPQTVSLTGIGQGFSVASSGPSTATVTPGQTANYSISVSPVGDFNQKVALSCTGAPAGATCTVPASVTLNGSSPTTVKVTVTTSASMASLLHPYPFSLRGSWLAPWLVFPCLTGLVLLIGGSRRRDQKFGRALRGFAAGFATWCLISFAIGLASCGGSSSTNSNGTPYDLTVTGTFVSGSATLTNSTKLTLIIQ
jgi:FG-GAP-like repeat/Abnormal spindle-like microcephaly-assoc'd, ASPM-SPD-2-Hydin